jgi:cell division protein FtsW
MPRAADVLVTAAFALLCLGVLFVNSAGMSVAVPNAEGVLPEPVTFQAILFSRSTVYMVLAIAALLCASMVPMGRIGASRASIAWIPALWPVAILLLISVYIPGLGHQANGSHRWITLPAGLTFQPSEVAKWSAILVVAWYARAFGDRLPFFFKGLLPALIILGSLTVLVTLEDLGTGVLIAISGGIVLVAAGARIWHFVMLAPIGLMGVVAALVASPYRLDRLRAFVNPFEDPDGTGYHIIQSLVAIANGRGFGRGLGFGLQKFGYLPEDRTDFLFAVVCEELGVAGAAIVLCLYATLITAAWAIMRRQHDPFRKLLALGIVSTIAVQALMNLTVVTGLAPTKGIALPLMSSGGTGWILTAGALGVLVAMDRAARREPAAVPDAEYPALHPPLSMPTS